ncbi:MAG TPA: fumarate hydratase [Ruminococcaceae bacterium]|nr:fumarate hydratase [Oscillospiraceae bacterium]
MREIQAKTLCAKVKELFLQANYRIGPDILSALHTASEKEHSPTGRAVLQQLIENDQIAANEKIAICQDTGISVLFIHLGQDVHLTNGNFNEAIQQGVKEAYQEGYLRKSIVTDPVFDRNNTGDNTPAVIHVDIVPGNQIEIEVSPKGFGSENMSALKMLTPADGEKGVRNFIMETVQKAGPNPCPPIVVGVGIGSTIEMAAKIAKKATMRKVGSRNFDPRYAKMEMELLQNINKLGIGPAGLGGNTTALAVNIEWLPAHIASLPVVVNICCHAARHAKGVI